MFMYQRGIEILLDKKKGHVDLKFCTKIVQKLMEMTFHLPSRLDSMMALPILDSLTTIEGIK